VAKQDPTPCFSLPRTTRVRVLMSFFPSMDSALESARSESADRKADRK
jgi:hypothetical protein